MDWLTLKSEMVRDNDLPRRSFDVAALAAIRDGVMYDHILSPFAQERNGAGEYVPLSKRRPSVQSNLARTVVDNSVSLLFSEYHFPRFQSPDATTLEALELAVKHSKLNEVMIEAAIIGSVGSVAIWLRVIKQRLYFNVVETTYLTPTFDPDAPDQLAQVTERYKVDANELIDRGYNVKPTDGKYWFQRVWTTTQEVWYLPKPIGEPGAMRIDVDRTVQHNLGFCPMLWLKNLPGGRNDIDGRATFAPGIDTIIELDYLLSQSGRGLKYASDPLLVISGDAGSAPQVGGAANALVLESEEADAKLLELQGGAAAAVLEQVRFLRETALESCGGVRLQPEKAVGAQSGRALEILHQSLIWLADKLRISYGEGGLVTLAKMICRASDVVAGGLLINDKPFRNLNSDGVGLIWADWFEPSAHDMLETSQALNTLIMAEVVSRETALNIVSPVYDIEDKAGELAKITAEVAAQDARAIALAAVVQAKETLPA